MVSKDDLLDLFERMARENWAYAFGAAREGCVDCSGAFVFAYEQLGGPAIAHGSNSILRQSMGQLLPMSAAQPGYAAVKIRAWSEAEAGNRWHGQAPGDCYHIGLVGRDGRILNARNEISGFVASDPDDGFSGCAPLADVRYAQDQEGETVLYRAQVITQSDPLRVRAWPENGRVLGSVPRGALVSVLADNGDGWPRVRYGEWEGYVSAAYLSRVSDEEGGQQQKTALVREDGTRIVLSGVWRIAQDESP